MTARPAALAATRVLAMVLRHVYLMRKSWPRLLELMYWPSVQMILWGFIAKFFSAHSPWLAQAPGLLIAAVLLWDVLFRGQLGVSLTFFEELYSRNLGHLFVSPLRPIELVGATLAISLVRTTIGVGGAAVLAVPFYGFSILELGWALPVFFGLLMMLAWSIGLMVAALVLRWGLGAESFAWALIFAVAPVSGVYYPISVLPGWLQPVAHALPSSYVFEGLRALLVEQRVDVSLMVRALALDVVYLAAGIAVFLATFHVARRRGLLLQTGE